MEELRRGRDEEIAPTESTTCEYARKIVYDDVSTLLAVEEIRVHLPQSLTEIVARLQTESRCTIF